MANLITYNQIVDILKDIAQRHYQINSFYLGRDWELENDNDVVYPVFQVYPESARMPISNGEYKTIEVALNCKVVDLVRQSESNEKDVHSDCLRISQDIINELNQHPFYIRSNASLTGDINISSIEEFEDDYTAGWGFVLNLKLININSYCGLPFEEITGYSAAGPTSTGFSFAVQYLTCDTVTGCTSFQTYVQNAVNAVSADTNTFTSLTATTISAQTTIMGTAILTATTSTTVDCTANTNFRYILTANTTFDVSNIRNGQTIVIAARQDATGSRTVSWTGGTNSFLWPGGTTPTQTSTANKTDVYTLIRMSNTIYGSSVQNF